eukprot:TRINITY_DN15022_c0_g1_i1.p1 TRINITY_DN15022_c0_g1~~TRINITY_DN15022_c0_g1_i1.p1  ORF type:complete len:288 (+),score=20.47 TRINITY_DN15022_c0_g1_i1:61-924(+)
MSAVQPRYTLDFLKRKRDGSYTTEGKGIRTNFCILFKIFDEEMIRMFRRGQFRHLILSRSKDFNLWSIPKDFAVLDMPHFIVGDLKIAFRDLVTTHPRFPNPYCAVMDKGNYLEMAFTDLMFKRPDYIKILPRGNRSVLCRLYVCSQLIASDECIFRHYKEANRDVSATEAVTYSPVTQPQPARIPIPPLPVKIPVQAEMQVNFSHLLEQTTQFCIDAKSVNVAQSMQTDEAMSIDAPNSNPETQRIPVDPKPEIRAITKEQLYDLNAWGSSHHAPLNTSIFQLNTT